MNLAEMLAAADAATQDVDTSTKEFDLIPPGNYEVAVTASEGPKESKRTNPNNPAEHGQYLKIECTITGPSSVGRKVWMNNNILVYPKDGTAEEMKKAQTAMAMGAKERKVMLDSVGKNGIQSAEELVGATFTASIIVEKGKDGYKDKNVIKTVKPLGISSAQHYDPMGAVRTPEGCASIGIPPSAARTTAPKAKMPWEK